MQTSRLQNCVPVWRSLTQDSWILQSVIEHKIEFVTIPFQLQHRVPVTDMNSQSQVEIAQVEVQKLLNKGAITVEIPVEGHFIIPKKSGELRPVINLRSLNKFVKYQHFKMEGIRLCKTFTDSRRFFDYYRPQGRLFYESHSFRSSEISSFYMAEQSVPIYLPTLRAVECSSHIYTNLEASRSTSAGKGNSMCVLPGRHPHLGQIPKGVFRKHPAQLCSQELSSLAIKVWTWCLHRGITLTVEFFLGVDNILADEMSRNFNDCTEWQLLPEVFKKRCTDSGVSTNSRPVRITTEHTTPQLRIMASRPTSMAGRCILHQLEQPSRLHVSSILPVGKMPSESSSREIHSTTYSTSVEDTTLVSTNTRVNSTNAITATKASRYR